MAEMVNHPTDPLTTPAFIEPLDPRPCGYQPPPLMERLFSISQEIITNPSLDDVLHLIVHLATELVGCEMAGVLLLNADTGKLNFVATTQPAGRLFDIPVPLDASIAGAAFNSSSSLIVNDVPRDPRYYSKVDELMHSSSRSILAVPLTFREHKIGVLEAVNKKCGQFDETDVKMLVALAAQAAISLEMARLYRQAQGEIAQRIQVEEALRHHQEHLEELVKERTAEARRLAVTDVFTGLFNRGHLMMLGDQAILKAHKDHHAFSAIMIDGDHFKKINAIYGHAVGDEAIKRLADTARAFFRPADIIGRYSGDELVVLLPNTALHTAHELAERLLDQIRAVQIETPHGPFSITASIGVVEMDQARWQTLDSLIDLADQASCAAKQAGRNQVFVGNLLTEVQRMAFTDALTGLFNRGYWMLLGSQAMQEAQRNHHPFSAMMIDGDHFKSINDNYGHITGDRVAQAIAAVLRQHVRSTDIVGRYGGGDEYLVLMPNTNLQSAYKLAERLLHELRQLRINTPLGPVSLTASFGVAEMDPAHPQTLEALIDQADQAAYRSKRAGYNQVSVVMAEPAA